MMQTHLPSRIADHVDPIRRGLLVRIALRGFLIWINTEIKRPHVVLVPPPSCGGVYRSQIIYASAIPSLADGVIATAEDLSRLFSAPR